MKSKIFGRIFTVLMAAVMLICLASIFAGIRQEKDVASKLLRLHVIANSNSEEDQALKLKVRDAILKQAQHLTAAAKDSEDAKEKITSELLSLENAARQCLDENGISHPVTLEVEKCYFPTKNYGTFSLPAGEYEALRVKIGEAEGENWWCVLFPPLCNAAATEEFVSAAASAGISEDDIALMEGKRVIRFRLAELFAYIKSLIEG